MDQTLRIGTRGSPLALAQARMVAEALRAAHGWDADQIALVPMTTTGDQIKDRPLAEVGGKGLWTKELDLALIEGRTDISVHSMKDVETIRPAELVIGAMLVRADVRDRLVGADSVDALPVGARVGTSSPRRAAQLKRARPDLDIVPIRGNVATRLAKLEKGEADATLLAAAGLDRLGHPDIGVPLDALLPAPSQGAIGIETLANNRAALKLIAAIDHQPTHLCVAAERRLLEGLGGDCRSPVAALATMDGDIIRLDAEILTEDGSEHAVGQRRFACGDNEAPLDLARELLAAAGPGLNSLFSGWPAAS
jgi:hydroxymethylbilane synthase